MCKAPKPPKPKAPDKPEFLRNPYLDAAVGQSGVVDQLRLGRSSLRTDLAAGLGIRQSAAVPAPTNFGPTVRPIASRRGSSRPTRTRIA